MILDCWEKFALFLLISFPSAVISGMLVGLGVVAGKELLKKFCHSGDNS